MASEPSRLAEVGKRRSKTRRLVMRVMSGLSGYAIDGSDVGDEGLLLASEPFDTELDDIAGLQVARRLHAHANAGRRTGGDHVARMQGHELRQIGNEEGDAVDHGLRRTVLHLFA